MKPVRNYIRSVILLAPTRRLTVMNLALRGIEADLGPENADTFRRDRHHDLRADFAWVQHFIHHLASCGMAGFVFANGSHRVRESRSEVVQSRVARPFTQPVPDGVENIAEGSEASGTSKKMELKLTNVARASLEELRLDYEDYLRHRRLPLWPEADPRRKALVARRCATADAVAEWVKDVHGPDGQNGPGGQPRGKAPSTTPIPSIRSTYPEIAANAALVLIGVACALLDRQIESQAAAFTVEGGFTERLYRIRTERRKSEGR